MKKYKITKNFVSEFIKPIAEYSPNHSNVLVKVLRIDNEGKEVCTALQRDGKKGYNLNGVEKYNIIKAVRYDKVNKTSQQTYYIVMNLTPDCLTLDEGHKYYRDAKNAQEDILGAEEIEVEMLTPLPTTVEPIGTVEQPETETETEPVAETDDEQYNPLDEGLEEDEDIKQIIETYFKGFTFKEYIVFSKALIRILNGRDLTREPLDFNTADDYTKIGSTLIKMLNSKVCYEVFDLEQGDVKALEKAFRTFMWKIRGLNKWHINEIAKKIQNALHYNPKISNEVVDTDEALAYVV